MTNRNRAIRALTQLGKSLPNGSNIEVLIRLDDCEYVCHKFSVAEGRVQHRESHSSDFVETGREEALDGSSSIRWPG